MLTFDRIRGSASFINGVSAIGMLTASSCLSFMCHIAAIIAADGEMRIYLDGVLEETSAGKSHDTLLPHGTV